MRSLYAAMGEGFVSTSRPYNEFEDAKLGFTFFVVDDLDSGAICGSGIAFNRSAIEATDDRRWEFGSDLIVDAARGLRLQQLLVWYRLVHIHVRDDAEGVGDRTIFAVIAQNNDGSRITYQRSEFVKFVGDRDALAGKPVPATKDIYVDTSKSLVEAAKNLSEIHGAGQFGFTNSKGETKTIEVQFATNLDDAWPAIAEIGKGNP